jgi:hypothetical protein
MEKAARETDEISRGVDFESDVFPFSPEIRIPAVTLSSDDPSEAYTVLVMTMISILQARWNRGDRGWIKNYDRLYWTARHRQEILTQLVFEMFLPLDTRPVTREFPPSAKALLIETVGKWVGYQLASMSPDISTRSRSQIKLIAAKCTDLMPKSPEHFYRLGAVECFLGNKARALESFKKAKPLDVYLTELNPNALYGVASTDLFEATTSYGMSHEKALARFAAHAARAINTGDSSTRSSFRDSIDKFVKGRYVGQDLPTTLLVVNSLLEAEDKNVKST